MPRRSRSPSLHRSEYRETSRSRDSGRRDSYSSRTRDDHHSKDHYRHSGSSSHHNEASSSKVRRNSAQSAFEERDRRGSINDSSYRGKRDSRTERRDRREISSEDEKRLSLRELGIDRISEDDYFLKSTEFKLWLKDSRGKYLEETSNDSAHKYFRKFVRRWNDGILREKYYFASKRAAAPHHSDWQWEEKSVQPHQILPNDNAESSEDEIGPSLPSASSARQSQKPTTADLQLAREEAKDRYRAEKRSENKAAYNRADESVPKGVGKEGKMQEKRATNEENKKYREKDATEGFEADEGTLMGDSGSFAAALRARNAAQAKRQEQKEAAMADRVAADQERLQARRQKDAQTMDMFKAIAKSRFG